MSASNALRLGQNGLEAFNLSKSHLPFVVKSSVTICAARVLLSSSVYTQVLDRIVRFDPIHMINAFVGRKRPAEMLGHHPPMFKKPVSVLHLPIHGKIFGGDVSGANNNITIRRDFPSGNSFALGPLIPTFATFTLATRFALSIVIWALQLLNKSGQRIPPLCPAMRASYHSRQSPLVVNMDSLIITRNGGMFRNFFPRWAAHGFLQYIGNK
jgi:hypothetical protein